MHDAQSRHPLRKRPLKFSLLVTLMMGTVLIVVLLCVHLVYFFQIGNVTRNQVKDRAIAVARTLADSPEIQQALTLPATRNIIQPIASAVQQRNDLLFVVITNMQGIRFSHPNANMINQRFIGDDLLPALKGEENTSINHGVLAEALRVFTPVYDNQHRQIGVVAIGISLADVAEQIHSSRWYLLWITVFGAVMGALGTVVLVRKLKGILFGLEPYEISTLYELRQAILESVKEGVIAVDADAHVTLINPAAQQLLGEPALKTPFSAENLTNSTIMLTHLQAVLQGGRTCRDEEININGRVLLSNTVPVRSQNRIIGAVCTFRDKTEITHLMQRLSGMVNYVDALRERSHEFMNKLHVILGLLHMKNYTQVERYILKTANNYQTEIGSLLQKIKSPVIAGFLLSKINRVTDKGHQLTLDEASFLPDSGNEEQIAVLITVLGNLIENALEALADQPESEIHLMLHYQNDWLACEVSDDGPGIPAQQLTAIFEKGVSSKGQDRGVGLFLVKQQTDNLGGSISVESEPGVYTQFLVQLPWDRGNKTA